MERQVIDPHIKVSFIFSPSRESVSIPRILAIWILMAQHDQKDDQGSTAKNFDYNNLRILKRTTKGQRPRPREPRVWSTSQQSPPSLWSALNKVNVIFIITTIIIIVFIITINIIFTHAQIQIQIFRKCVCVQQEGKEFVRTNCRLLQVGPMFRAFLSFSFMIIWATEPGAVVPNAFFIYIERVLFR